MTPAPAPEKILVVDDDRSLRNLLAAILRRQGFAVEIVGNGREALEALSKGRYQLVLLDMMMPTMNGNELLAHLAASGRDDLPPIIILSGGIVPGEAGSDLVTASIQKPFELETLVDTVHASLARAGTDVRKKTVPVRLEKSGGAVIH